MAFEAPIIDREEGAEGEPASKPKQKGMDDTEILAMLSAEKQASIGFENGTELEKKRRTALEYMKGQMSDVPALANRSKAVSTDTIEAIETVLPDVLDILVGGEDVATFVPRGDEDVEGARQETDYVNYVAFSKLRPTGWMLAYTAIKDALSVDTGIIETRWEDNEVTEEEELKGISAIQLQRLVEEGAEIVSSTPAGYSVEPPPEVPAVEAMEAGSPEGAGQPGMPQPPMPEEPQLIQLPLFDVKIARKYDKGCIKCDAIDPMNLTVSVDTTIADIEQSPYLAIRAFPRAQQLLDQGFEANKVEQLNAYSPKSTNDTTDQARDLAGESTSSTNSAEGSGASDADGKSLMRTVEVHKHWIRADIEGTGKSQLWRIQTDSACKVILDKRKVDRIGLAVGTPFIQTHRFYGTSLAEKLVEIQKIKTALLRLMLDSGYFAMNQRMEMSEQQAGDNTLADLMRNEPGMPIRSKTGTAVRPIQAGQLGFDVGMMLEYASTMGETRTGVVRNAQGLNPDTLHDTAKGAMALMNMAQKRVRMIARVFAETLMKKWFLDIHALSRTHATRPEKIRLRGSFVDIDPSTFGDRADMVIEVGVGSGGKEQKLAILDRLLQFHEKVMLNHGPISSWRNVYDTIVSFAETGGFKGAERLLTDPDKAEPQEPQPNPEMEKVKMQAAADQAKLQADTQFKQQQAQTDAALRAQQSQVDAAQRQQQAETDARIKSEQAAQDLVIQRERMVMEGKLKREQMAAELQLKREQLAAELQLKRELELARIAMTPATPMPNGNASSGVHIGGDAG